MAKGNTEFLLYAAITFRGFMEILGSCKNLSNALRYMASDIVSTMIIGLEFVPISLSTMDSTCPLHNPYKIGVNVLSSAFQ